MRVDLTFANRKITIVMRQQFRETQLQFLLLSLLLFTFSTQISEERLKKTYWELLNKNSKK